MYKIWLPRNMTDVLFFIFCPILAHATDYYGKSLFLQDASAEYILTLSIFMLVINLGVGCTLL